MVDFERDPMHLGASATQDAAEVVSCQNGEAKLR